MAKKKYDSSDIKVLQNVDHIRQIPTMYIADTEEDGAFQLFKELLDNAIDEYLAGHVSRISVSCSDDGVVTVVDDGRGIPVNKHPFTKISTLTTIFTYTGAGGKFKGDSYTDAYRESVGLHGVGVTAVAALSEYLEVWTKRNGKVYYQRFEKGVPVTKVKIVKKRLKGTRISFKLDSSVFGEHVVSKERVKNRLNELAYICLDLDIFYVDGKNKHKFGKVTETFLEDTGKTFMHKPMVINSDDFYLEFAWEDSTETDIKVYVNTSPVYSGTPFTYIKKTVVSFFNEKSGKKLKNEPMKGLNVFCYLKLDKPKFQGQTKYKLMNTDIKATIETFLLPELLKFQVTERDTFTYIVNKCFDKIKLENDLNINKKTSKRKSSKTKTILPDKLCSVLYCKPEKRELYIVEGDSAAGSAKAARDTSYQEVLPVRGKILNADKANLGRLLKNTQIQEILISIGCNPDVKSLESFTIENLRVGKLILLMDGDPDGYHIVALFLKFIRKYLSVLIEENKVYVIDSPLFKGKIGSKRVFGHTKDEILKQNSKAIISRLKGHGEANAKDLAFYAMNPSTRKLIHIV